MKRLILSCAIIGIAAPAMADTVDFESGVDGRGTPITTQYWASHGVAFSVEGAEGDNGSLFLGDYAGSVRDGWGGAFGRDGLEPGFDMGDFFLAHPDANTTSVRDTLIDFASPVASAGFSIMDVDSLDSWEITAYDEDGNIITTTSIASGDAGTGDSMATQVLISQDVNVISQLRISFTGAPAPKIGFGFDDIEYIEVTIPAPAAGFAMLIGFAGMNRRRRG